MSELAWLRHKDIAVAGRGDIGAQGIRQAGRLMMMERSADFMSRVEQEVHAAMGGLFDPVVYVHVLTGLSGGTGSGCFLDVCYMVRDAARRMGRDVTILGYFFLPDVNLARIPMSSTSVRECVRANAYAAMQELDYCMGLPHNGGAFEQEYQGRRVVGWDRPPVDVPFLVGAQDPARNAVRNPYGHAMGAVVDLVLDSLADDRAAYGQSALKWLVVHAGPYAGWIDQQKRVGSSCVYCALGASSAGLPRRHMDTYLATELFAEFSRSPGCVPTKCIQCPRG